MAIDPPYRLDPFQNIINIHWSQKRPRLYYFVLTRTDSGIAYPYQQPTWGSWTGPFTYVLLNTYDPAYDPPEPEPSDPPPPPLDPENTASEPAEVSVRTYSLTTFLNGYVDWLSAGGNGFVLTSSFWLDAEVGWQYTFVPDFGFWPQGLYTIRLGSPLPVGWPPDIPPGENDPHPPLP